MNGKIDVKYSERFLKGLSRLPKEIIAKAQERENVFKMNPFDPRLYTHKLHGKEKDVWAFSVVHKYRIKFLFLHDRSVLFLDIGTYEIYK